jgi:hypothetical protein
MKKSSLLVISFVTMTAISQQLKGQSLYEKDLCDLYKSGIIEHLIGSNQKVIFKCDSSFTVYTYANNFPEQNQKSPTSLAKLNSVEDYKILDIDSCKIVPYGVEKVFGQQGGLSILSYRTVEGRTIEQFFYSNGSLAEIIFLAQNKLDGLSSSFYNNGNIKSIGLYAKGFKSGMWSYYYPNGNLNVSGSYYKSYLMVNFVNPNSYELVNENGVIVKTVEHDLSYKQLIDSLANALPDLNIRDTIDGIYQIGDVYCYQRDGVWGYYSKEGELIKKEYYKKGELLRTEE